MRWPVWAAACVLALHGIVFATEPPGAARAEPAGPAPAAVPLRLLNQDPVSLSGCARLGVRTPGAVSDPPYMLKSTDAGFPGAVGVFVQTGTGAAGVGRVACPVGVIVPTAPRDSDAPAPPAALFLQTTWWRAIRATSTRARRTR